MRRWMLCSLTLCGLLVSVPLHAQEKIFLKNGKEVKLPIKKESASSVVAGTETFPADDIVEIEYELKPTTVMINNFRKARKDEKDSLEEKANRKALLGTAIKQYEEAIEKMDPQPMARRNLEFRIAALRARQALELDAFKEDAAKKLTDFKTKHPDSWQIGHAMRLLAMVQLAQKKYAEAEATYVALAGLPVSDDTKFEAELQAAMVNVQTKNFAKAQKGLADLAGKAKGNKIGMRARVAEAECLAADNKTAEANKLLQGILTDSTDKNLKAMAYNTLGKNLFTQGQLQEARWEFLWVDVVYNQDKAEHAKALYYLAKIFDQLKEADRAQECRELLLTDRQFAGFEYQRKAQEESKAQ